MACDLPKAGEASRLKERFADASFKHLWLVEGRGLRESYKERNARLLVRLHVPSFVYILFSLSCILGSCLRISVRAVVVNPHFPEAALLRLPEKPVIEGIDSPLLNTLMGKAAHPAQAITPSSSIIMLHGSDRSFLLFSRHVPSRLSSQSLANLFQASTAE